ncbi:unnamed protein product, partial [Echinostoma caproni]|uniref:Uncharacterized protein n=1 Tax=Echinostoma caproni TaxID=27848 RepID=A0A183A037_9TREM
MMPQTTTIVPDIDEREESEEPQKHTQKPTPVLKCFLEQEDNKTPVETEIIRKYPQKPHRVNGPDNGKPKEGDGENLYGGYGPNGGNAGGPTDNGGGGPGGYGPNGRGPNGGNGGGPTDNGGGGPGGYGPNGGGPNGGNGGGPTDNGGGGPGGG